MYLLETKLSVCKRTFKSTGELLEKQLIFTNN